MAEAIFNAKNGGTDHRAISAGLYPASRIQPLTIEVLEEAGISTAELKPDQVTDELSSRADRVIAMDSFIAGELAGAAHEAWDIPDPYKLGIESYRRTRDILTNNIQNLINELNKINNHD
ncbi:MAG: low molecular weight phosphatase family protein [Thermoplasmata archaeon]|nr:MAG: low molecular weight phosphatase family protein [Thermoplasmata archaeon]